MGWEGKDGCVVSPGARVKGGPCSLKGREPQIDTDEHGWGFSGCEALFGEKDGVDPEFKTRCVGLGTTNEHRWEFVSGPGPYSGRRMEVEPGSSVDATGVADRRVLSSRRCFESPPRFASGRSLSDYSGHGRFAPIGWDLRPGVDPRNRAILMGGHTTARGGAL